MSISLGEQEESMHLRLHCWVGLSALLLIAPISRALTPTFIESADGKRLVQMDDPETNEPNLVISDPDSGKTLLYVHNKELLKDIHDEAFMIVDDDAVRPSANGVSLATFDGEDIRHGKNGDVVMNYHHPDLCPNAQANRLYRVNGPELTKAQLVAVLYVLKPEIFKLTPEEEAAQKKAMADANAEAERIAAADPIVGKWMVLNGNGPVEKIGKGTISFGTKNGEFSTIDFDYQAGGGPSWSGVALSKTVNNQREIWTAYGTPKTVGLCVYEIDGGKLTGTWYPWYYDGDKKNLGSEQLQGPESLDGDFNIVAAKAPNTGAAYAGTVTIKPFEIVGADDDDKPYQITWNFGATKVQGIGLKRGKYLIVSSGTGADTNVGRFTYDNGSFNGYFFKLGSKDLGQLAATTQ
jgi:hypothetical protein